MISIYQKLARGKGIIQFGLRNEKNINIITDKLFEEFEFIPNGIDTHMANDNFVRVVMF